MKRLIPTLTATLLVLPSWGWADASRFFEDKERGWFFYEPKPDPPPEQEEEKPPVPMAAATTSSVKGPETGPAVFSVEWIRTKLPQLRDHAIDNPTEDNVAAFYYAQKLMMDRAQVFSDVGQRVVEKDPILDERTRLPLAAAAKMGVLKDSTEAKKAVLSKMAKVGGLWVIHDPKCSYCKEQLSSLQFFLKEFPFELMIMTKGDVNERFPGLEHVPVRPEAGLVERLQIMTTPAVVFVRPPKDLYVVSQGLLANSELESRLMVAAEELGLVSGEELERMHPDRKGVWRDTQLAADGVDPNDPKSWVGYLKKQVMETYGSNVEGGESNGE